MAAKSYVRIGDLLSAIGDDIERERGEAIPNRPSGAIGKMPRARRTRQPVKYARPEGGMLPRQARQARAAGIANATKLTADYGPGQTPTQFTVTGNKRVNVPPRRGRFDKAPRPEGRHIVGRPPTPMFDTRMPWE